MASNREVNVKLLVATSNKGKVVEIEHEFREAGLDAQFLGLKDLPSGWADVVEDRPTFVGNATKKARHFAKLSGMLTLADDSGLCVDALDGAPGVFSARYAGEPCDNAANNRKLLAAMDAVPEGKRGGQFVCAMALCAPVADLAVFVDEVKGVILRELKGTNGFGYDPLFYFPEFGKTTAELDMKTKGTISHRGKALRKMIGFLTAHRGLLS